MHGVRGRMRADAVLPVRGEGVDEARTMAIACRVLARFGRDSAKWPVRVQGRGLSLGERGTNPPTGNLVRSR